MRIQIAAMMLLILTACTSRPPVRGAGAADALDVAALASDPGAYKRVQGKSLEPTEKYTLSFVEFDAHGRPARKEQIESAAEVIRDVPRGGKSVVVLFVHGWGHSADTLDTHVIGVRQALSGLAHAIPDRKVVGIYVGWPARWLKGPLHYLTFWDRSRAAQKISRTPEVRDVLQRFRTLVEEHRSAGTDIVSVAVGHSLGGKFLFTPMEECLERDTCKELPESPQDLPPFGDLVLLVNPAQDIHDFNAFTEYADDLPEETRPVVVILSSEADRVVGRTYRIGRTLRNIVSPWNWSSFRSESIGLGWDRTQVTHTLCLTEADGRPSQECGDKLRSAPLSSVEEYGQAELRRHSTRQGPFIVVRVDGRLINDHSDIFNEPFLTFLRAFVKKSVGEVSAAAPGLADKTPL